MIFPKSLDILLRASLVRNTTKAGEVTNTGNIELDMIDLLSQELGFSYRVYSDKFRKNGDLYAGNWILEERMYVWSAYPYDISDITFAICKPDYVSNSLGFLRSFTMPLWIAFFLFVVLMAIATFLIFRGRVLFPTVLFYSSVTLMGQHRNWKPKSNAQKLLVLSWSVGITFLTLAYAAVILSFLAVPGREKGITNFEELHDAIKQGKATALKFEGDNVDSMLIKSGLEKLKLIGENIQKQNTISRGSKGNFLEVIKPNVAVIGARSFLELYYWGDEHFISTDSIFPFMRIMYEWTEKGFCCINKVNSAIHRIWGAGLYRKKISDVNYKAMLYYRSKFQNMYSRNGSTIQSLNLSDMSGAFYLLLTGHTIVLLCLVCEIVNHRYYGKIPATLNYMSKIVRKD